MGCITSCGKAILIILNVLFLILSLAILGVGVVLRFFADNIAKLMLGAISIADSTTQSDFGIPSMEDVREMPFLGDIGIALIIFGSVLFVISFLACCGACCSNRVMLILFALLMFILVTSQAVVGGLFLAKESVLHSTISNTLADKVKKEFKKDGKDVFSFSINLLNYQLKCCGIRSYTEFQDGRPPSCCKREVIEGNDSTQKLQCQNSLPSAQWNEEGCYNKIQNLVLNELVIAAVVLAVLLFLQVLEIVFAILIVVDESSKVGPV